MQRQDKHIVPQKPPSRTSEQVSRDILTAANVAPDSTPPAIAGLLAPALSETQHAALEQYRLGLNVVILPPHKKGGISTKLQQTTRLFFDENDPYNPEGLLAAAAGECNLGIMTGHTSGKNGTHLTVIDCETERVLAAVIRELTRLGIPIYGVKSYRGGHIYIRTRRRMKPRKIHGVIEFITHKFHVLTYPSTRIIDHTTGEVHNYTRFGDAIEPPLVDSHEIAFDLGDGTVLKLDSRPAPRNRGLNTLTQHYLANGRTYEDGRKAAFLQAACDLWGNQHSVDEIAARLIPIVEKSGFSGMTHDQAIKKAWEIIKWACNKPRNTSKPKYAQWQLALAYVYDHPFTGDTRRRNRLKAVISALAYRARVDTNGYGIFRATERELVLLTGIKKRATIRRAISELIELGLIRRITQQLPADAPKQKYREANEFAWCKSDVWYPLASKMLEPVSYSGYQTGIFETDAIEAISDSAGYVYEAMKTRAYPMKVREIAKLANVSESAVRRALDKDCLLVSQGLIQRVQGGWIAQRTTKPRLNELIAAPAGVLGAKQAFKDKLDSERALYAVRDVLRFRWSRSGAAYQEKLREIADYHKALHPDQYGENPPILPKPHTPKPKTEQAQIAKSYPLGNTPLSPIGEMSTTVDTLTIVNTPDPDTTLNQGVQLIAHPETVVSEISDNHPLAADIPLWVCPNCTQQHFGDTPPDMCAYCHNLTTWKPLNDAAFMLLLAHDTGGVIAGTITRRSAAKSNVAMDTARPSDSSLHGDKPTPTSEPPPAPRSETVGGMKVVQARELPAPANGENVSQNTQGYTAENACNVSKFLYDEGVIDKETHLENGRNIQAWKLDKNTAAINQFTAEYIRRKEAHKAAKSNSRKVRKYA